MLLEKLFLDYGDEEVVDEELHEEELLLDKLIE
jgi:hypothetical protein